MSQHNEHLWHILLLAYIPIVIGASGIILAAFLSNRSK